MDDDGDGRHGDPEASEGTMNRFGAVLKTKVLGGVLVAGMALPAVAGVPVLAQSRGGYGAGGYVQSGYRDGYNNGFYGNGRDYYGNGRDYYHHDHRVVGPGTGALIGAGAGALLGGILGGGKGALIGGAAGAGVGAVAGAAHRDAQRGYGYDGWNRGYGDNGYRGYGYSNNGYAYGGPYRY